MSTNLAVSDAGISVIRNESANSTNAKVFLFRFRNFLDFYPDNKKIRFPFLFEIRHYGVPCMILQQTFFPK